MVEEKAVRHEKPRPVAYCARCLTPNASDHSSGLKCSRATCKGTYRSAIEPYDWARCGACGGTGYVADAHCENCLALGWILTRDLLSVRPVGTN